MPSNRRDMTVRVVPLRSRDASDARVAGTVAERVALVATLSEAQWSRTGEHRPPYTRATMPVLITPLGARRDRD